jgi:hypothetical protein
MPGKHPRRVHSEIPVREPMKTLIRMGALDYLKVGENENVSIKR